VKEALETVLQNEGVFNYKTLESDRGFLIHVAGTYENINPNLKGYHLTIDSWRQDRTERRMDGRCPKESGIPTWRVWRMMMKEKQ